MRFHTQSTEKRSGDELVRDWVEDMGSIAKAEREAGLTVGNLRVWLHDPDRGLTGDNTRKLARAAGLPTEAVLFRDDPIKSLDIWNWVRHARG